MRAPVGSDACDEMRKRLLDRRLPVLRRKRAKRSFIGVAIWNCLGAFLHGNQLLVH